jgi:hypothetical protein
VNERAVSSPQAALQLLKDSGFSDAQLEAAGLGSQAAMNDKARYAMAPDLVKALLPHQDLLGQGQAGGAEALNVKGQNIVLLSQGTVSGAKYGVGRSSDRVTILNPGQFDALSTANKQLLSQASAADVIETNYRRYVWLGGDATVDLSAVGTFNNGLLWREVAAAEAALPQLPVLTSSDGISVPRRQSAIRGAVGPGVAWRVGALRSVAVLKQPRRQQRKNARRLTEGGELLI